VKLVTFDYNGLNRQTLGALNDAGTAVIDLQAVHRRRAGIDHSALASMQDLIEGGSAGLDVARSCLDSASEKETHALTEVRLRAPLPRPLQIRDCLCFEEHLVGSMAAATRFTGGEPSQLQQSMLRVFRAQPIYYKANRFAVIGPEQEVTWPSYSSLMDYELEIGMVLGRTGRNIAREAAEEYIFGYTIFNDLSARDTQMVEMEGGLGPAKSKDFDGANILGPCIVTADQFNPNNANMTVRVNGEVRSAGNCGSMKHRFEDLIAYISRDETLHAGEILGSGTVGGGCGMEVGRLLESGDIIELDVEGIGVLRNRIFAASNKDKDS
jgi:2-keto-4-pentenoate hydratase/2-oxohepta-3-ene-1,7-dioic acid hydratase in catechol pathway